MAVTSAPQAMLPQHLWDTKQRVHISTWHYKRESAHVGSFPMIVGYFLTIFSTSVVIVSRYIVYLFSIDCSPSCCGFDPEFPLIAVWVLGSLGLSFHFTKILAFVKPELHLYCAHTRIGQGHAGTPRTARAHSSSVVAHTHVLNAFFFDTYVVIIMCIVHTGLPSSS